MAALVLVLTSLLAAGSYASLTAQAQPIDNLGRWLEDYVGQCDGDPSAGFNPKACRAKVRRARRGYRGRLLRVRIEEPASSLRLAGFNRRKGAFQLNLVPFFSARGLGLSVGRPRRVNRDGLPVMKHIPVWVKLPEDTPPFVFRRNLERGMVQLEMVVVAKTTYRLPRKRNSAIRGVEVTLRGFQLVEARSGEVLAEATYQE